MSYHKGEKEMSAIDAWKKLNGCIDTAYYIGSKAKEEIDLSLADKQKVEKVVAAKILKKNKV